MILVTLHTCSPKQSEGEAERLMGRSFILNQRNVLLRMDCIMITEVILQNRLKVQRLRTCQLRDILY